MTSLSHILCFHYTPSHLAIRIFRRVFDQPALGLIQAEGIVDNIIQACFQVDDLICEGLMFGFLTGQIAAPLRPFAQRNLAPEAAVDLITERLFVLKLPPLIQRHPRADRLAVELVDQRLPEVLVQSIA